MGNDGGSIPTRRELVKEAARNPTTSELKESQQEQQAHYWTTDPISLASLAQPVVSDSSGKLYNKDTILEYLVEGSRKEEAEKETRGAVKSLKDVVELRFDVEDGDGEAKINGASNGAKKWQHWKCPITGARLGPGSKAVYLVPCGHVFSTIAIKEVSGEKCLVCETAYASNDIIPILPTVDTDIARLSLRVKTLQERGLSHSLKKATGNKKRKKQAGEEEAAENGVDRKAAKNKKADKNGDEKTAVSAENGGINNTTTANLATKVREEQALSKKRKTDNDNVKSLFSNRDDTAHHGKSSDFMTRGFSLPAGKKG